ncbi:hypothetical protein [Shimia sediminis]|uniref:hypothetical protein n=1 Tax=Shimia sediminis TaxID=2497945 RepID=UPI000F8F4D84|nr:hypothetical protein [Shimia sediminis]
MSGAGVDGIPAVMEEFCDSGQNWKGYHLFNEVTGTEAVASAFWQPMRHRLTQMQQRLNAVHYPWLMQAVAVRLFGDPAPIQRDFLLDDVRGLPATQGLASLAHIQVEAEDGYAEAQLDRTTSVGLIRDVHSIRTQRAAQWSQSDEPNTIFARAAFGSTNPDGG